MDSKKNRKEEQEIVSQDEGNGCQEEGAQRRVQEREE